MRYFYDTEFIDNGRTIELISIGVAAEDGGVRGDHDTFFDGGVPFLRADQIAVFVLGKTECSQGDALIDLDIGGNVGGFTDDDTGTVIDKE